MKSYLALLGLLFVMGWLFPTNALSVDQNGIKSSVTQRSH